MKASDLLGVVIRVCGFLAIVWAMWHGWGAAQGIPGGVLRGEMPLRTAAVWLFTVGVAFGLGVVCFACADWLVALSYRRPLPDSAPRAAGAICPREIFGLIVRIMGMAVFLYGGYYLLYGVGDAVGLVKEDSPGEMRSYFVLGIPATFCGLAMVGAAPLVVRFSYYLTDRHSTHVPVASTERNVPSANPQGGANGRQPVGSEANRAPAAAAPRRSP